MRSPNCSSATHQERGGNLNEYQLRQRMIDAGRTPEEVEDRLSDLASDAYDDEQDRKAEQHFKEKANEAVRS